MRHATAEEIGKKAKAVKYCERILSIADKKGMCTVKHGNTGVSFTIVKNDALYTLFQSIKFKLLHELNAIKVITENAQGGRYLPAPVGSAPTNDMIADELERKRQQRREYQARYRAKKQAEKAAKQEES